MPLVSMSDAARLAGVSRQHLYRLIESGKISVSAKPGGQRAIDTSELLRVFGELKSPGEQGRTDRSVTTHPVHALHQETAHKVDLLEAEVRHLRDALRAAEARVQAAESMQERLVGIVASAQRLLEYQPAKAASKKTSRPTKPGAKTPGSRTTQKTKGVTSKKPARAAPKAKKARKATARTVTK